ncbi:ribonuclease H protein [Trifolium medium]|uniref:Ribonuclease H protein n=1 Tax=Trifolium medium TaxID=97028 RepID=A0A392PCM4_9FABA|nr:ribonuclease H protein [Trifolium medium]
MLHSCSMAFDNQFQDTAHASSQDLVAWSRSSEGTVCLNVDGSLLGSPQSTGFGRLVRNSDGTFLGGFYGVATQASILYADIMALLHGLELCWDKGFRRVICFSDSLQTVTLVKNGVSPYHQFANEIVSIRQLLDRDWSVAVDPL